SRYGYLYPLMTRGYATENMVADFLEALRLRTPRIIIDTRNPRFCPLDRDCGSISLDGEGLVSDEVALRDVRSWIKGHYREVYRTAYYTLYSERGDETEMDRFVR
ncbi:MAG: hypothetical protein ACREA0_19730, partial [bacterium]